MFTRRAWKAACFVALALVLNASFDVRAEDTEFSYGGYVKMDVLSTYYRNGDVASASPLRDFHLPSQIPIGDTNENYDLDFHVKESRFHFGTKTTFEDSLQGMYIGQLTVDKVAEDTQASADKWFEPQ